MLTTTLVFTTLLALPQGAESKTDPAEVAAKIKAALDAGPAPAVEVIRKLGTTADPRVTKVVAGGLKQGDVEVKTAAILALRFNPDKSAVTELLRVKGDKKIVDDVDFGPAYFYALGQHADAKALPFLLRNLHVTRRGDKVMAARIHAIGRMRTRAAVVALIKYSKSSKRGGQGNDVNLALAALTGHDGGRGRGRWTAWWNDNKSSFKIAAKEPELPRKLARNWERLWRKPGEESAKSKRRKKRGKAGQGGEGKTGEGKSGEGKTGEGKSGRNERRRRRRR